RYTQRLLYETPGNDGISIVQRCRAMALIPALALGMLVSAWAWRLAGPVAAMVATTLWAFDPNLLAHGVLAKNDVAIALAYAWMGFAIWSVGKRLTWLSASSLCLAIAVAPMIKLSGIAFLPIAAIVLFVRAMMNRPWEVMGRSSLGRPSKCAAVAGLMLCAALGSYLLLWACYGFRFNAGPGELRLDTDRIEAVLRDDQIAAAKTVAWRPDLPLRILDFTRQHHLLPEAWIAGCLFTRLSPYIRSSYLLGTIYLGGKWYYFPLAFLFKEPLATLAALALAAIVALAAARRGRLKNNFHAQWAVICLALPAGIYAAAALTATLNLGIRYLFPIYPLIFIGVGWVVADLCKNSRPARAIVMALTIGHIAETAAAYPNFIPFFNIACGRYRGGISLLADSNLDWGQDLPLLAQWQKNHPRAKLYLIYIGLCDPSAYHINATRLWSGADLQPYPRFPNTGGYVAIGATPLATSQPGSFAYQFRDQTPEVILGGSIYLFRFDEPIPADSH
ncbi:MAG TPA: hypothetical protein VMD30_00340, partial [Tepidisphaeraceae bacterium]|nr:hypothetical protein [Tepidisphaeraceae bacterium]